MARSTGPRIYEVVDEYYKSLDFRNLAPATQKDYRYCIKALLEIEHPRCKFNKASMNTVTPPMAQLPTISGLRRVSHGLHIALPLPPSSGTMASVLGTAR